MILPHLLAYVPVIRPRVLQSQPGKGPGHPSLRKAASEALTKQAHVLKRMDFAFILARIPVPADFDLVHTHHRVERQKAVALQLDRRKLRGCLLGGGPAKRLRCDGCAAGQRGGLQKRAAVDLHVLAGPGFA